ncbi:MAG: endonuclease/exonuclease/phosphatase family protein [Bacteriovoracaceae bacterium]|nr:endonuclease/exonuclease/phosphatase family protein [Bacteriovoracaceae bacterium]
MPLISYFHLFLFLWSPLTWGGLGYLVKEEGHATITLMQEASTSDKEELSLLVWNIYKEGKRNFKKSLEHLIDTTKPDILMLQEAIYPTDLCLKESDCYFSSAFYKKEKHFGVLTSSRYPLETANTIHSDLMEPLLKIPKSSLANVLNTPKGPLLIINTHGINFVGLHAYQTQMKEITEFIQDWNGAVIWAGDFNTWNPGRNAILEDSTKKLSIKKVLLTNIQHIKRFLGHSLDHIFVRGLEVKEAKVIVTKGSDHNPLFLRVKLDYHGTD